MISDFTVPWVAAESKYGWKLGLEWIENKNELIASSGWNTLANIVALKPDDELDIKKLKSLLSRVEKEIHAAPNRVRYNMNTFVISIGAYVSALTADAVKTANKIGTVTVDMGGTACKVPAAADYIAKIKDRGSIGKKKKTVRC